jgi:hypothetical protein
MKEAELYIPVKKLFTEIGYSVKGEINNVDLVAISSEDNLTIMVEFKLQLGFKLVLQAVNRQKMTDFVYVAIPRPSSKIMRSKSYKEKIHLLRRLEIGLIYVTLESEYSYAQIIEEPRPYNRKTSISRNKKKKELLLNEMKSRHGDFNLGGTKGKVLTAYKEKALLIAYNLKDGPKSTKEIKSTTHNEKAGTVLISNFYGWYERVEKGIYQLSDSGKEALVIYKNLIDLMT